MSVIKIYGKKEESQGVYYEVNESDAPLGVGGMGQVFKGMRVDSRTGLRREVAIKFLFDDLPPASIERARREASIQISNENLVEMLDFIEMETPTGNGGTSVRYHVVSELLHGVMLFDLLNGKTTDKNGADVEYARELYGLYNNNCAAFAIQIAKNILSGIMALHDSGYIHRDIDPSNIMVTSDRKVKLIDFGISKQLSTLNTEDHQLTTAGQFMGKAAYAAPELAIGDIAHQNETTDVYAIGIMLYQLITGSLPFDGPTHEILQMQINNKMPLQNVKDKGIREIIKKATAKKQVERYQSAAEFRVALEQLEKSMRSTGGTAGGGGKPVNKTLIYVAAAVVAVVATVAIVLTSGGGGSKLDGPDPQMLAQRADSLRNVVIDSPDIIVQRDSLTGVDVKSAGALTADAMSLLSDSTTFVAGMSGLKSVIDRGYKSSTEAAYHMACIYMHRDLPATVLENAQKHVAKDFKQAEQMYNKAFELDSLNHKSLYGQGYRYLGGAPTFSVERDLARAAYYFEKGRDRAAQVGDTTYVALCEQYMEMCGDVK